MYLPTIQDTIRRLVHAGRLVELSEDSEFVKLADALMSLDRERLDRAILATKKVLSDWADRELDNWWGAITSIDRLQGVDDVSDFLGDSTYVSRIRRFMEAGNSGVSLESIRMAAESGAGVPIRAKKALGRIILEPLESVTPPQVAGAIRAARRVAPARAIVEMGTAETFDPEPVKAAYSPSVYIGENPRTRMRGSQYDSPNEAVYVTSNIWDRANEGSIFPTDGLPGNAMKGGAWHTSPLGFGKRVALVVSMEDEPFNRVKFSISPGTWMVEFRRPNGETLHRERLVIEEGWYVMSRTFKFVRDVQIYLLFTQAAQDTNDLFIKGLYVGARVKEDNRKDWLALGGFKGEGDPRQIVNGEASNILSGGSWIAAPSPSNNSQRVLYATLGGVPRRVESLLMKTITPGCIFKVAYSNDRIDKDEEYEKANWTSIPGLYEMRNGRVKVRSFTGQHIRITFTRLRPMLMRDYQPPEEAI